MYVRAHTHVSCSTFFFFFIQLCSFFVDIWKRPIIYGKEVENVRFTLNLPLLEKMLGLFQVVPYPLV